MADNDANQDSQLKEPVADYAAFSKSQFLDDIERRLKQFMLRCVKVCRTLPVGFDAQHFGRQLHRQLLPTLEPFAGEEVRKSIMPNLVSPWKSWMSHCFGSKHLRLPKLYPNLA